MKKTEAKKDVLQLSLTESQKTLLWTALQSKRQLIKEEIAYLERQGCIESHIRPHRVQLKEANDLLFTLEAFLKA